MRLWTSPRRCDETDCIRFTATLADRRASLQAAGEWTQWGGPRRNFTSDAKGLATSWPAGGPETAVDARARRGALVDSRRWVTALHDVSPARVDVHDPAFPGGGHHLAGRRDREDRLGAPLSRADRRPRFRVRRRPALDPPDRRLEAVRREHAQGALRAGQAVGQGPLVPQHDQGVRRGHAGTGILAESHRIPRQRHPAGGRSPAP